MSRASPRPRSGELSNAVMVGVMNALRLVLVRRLYCSCRAMRSRSLDIVRAGALAQLLIMDQRRLGAERHRLAAAERPFAAVAVVGTDIAVDVEAPLVG